MLELLGVIPRLRLKLIALYFFAFKATCSQQRTVAMDCCQRSIAFHTNFPRLLLTPLRRRETPISSHMRQTVDANDPVCNCIEIETNCVYREITSVSVAQLGAEGGIASAVGECDCPSVQTNFPNHAEKW